MKMVRLRALDVLKCIHEQPLTVQRIPYPCRSIIEAAGVDYDKVKSVPASAIKASHEYAEFCFRFDKKELARREAQDPDTHGWMVGGWWLNRGPMAEKELHGLEFVVDTEKIEMERTPVLMAAV